MSESTDRQRKQEQSKTNKQTSRQKDRRTVRQMEEKTTLHWAYLCEYAIEIIEMEMQNPHTKWKCDCGLGNAIGNANRNGSVAK